MALLNLPNELIIQILSYLTHRDLIACQLCNTTLHIIIKDSVLLQFRIALSTFKATDNPACPLNLSGRFQALKDSEDAWFRLRKDFTHNITVNHELSGIYDLSGGVFLLGNDAGTALHYIKLPSSIGDDIRWQKLQLDQSEGTIIDMGFCIYEHDLLAVITTKPRLIGATRTTNDIRICLFKLSTGEPHPAAKQSTIHVLSSQGRPGVSIEIVGDHLVLILTFRRSELLLHDRIFVYDWRNAVQKMAFSAPHCSYSGLVFLSENLILIPNAHTNALEIWDILSTSKSPRPACILRLPELEENNSVAYIACRGEPNPIGRRSQLQSDRPFYQSSQDAIILFHISVLLGDPVAHQLQHGGELIRHTYKLFVHRRALCEVYDRCCAEVNSKFSAVRVGDSGSLEFEDPGLNGFGSLIQDEDSGLGLIGEDDEEMVVYPEDDVDEEMVVDPEDDDDNWVSDDDSENEDDDVVRATDDDPIPLPWSSWGPPITRWFLADVNSISWITTTVGQRGVLMGQPYRARRRQYVILDFNPENLRRAEQKLLESGPISPSRIQCVRNWQGLQTEGVYKDPVIGDLPFVVCVSENLHAWNGVLIDEDRVLGLMLADSGDIGLIEVHHFG